QSYIEGKRFAFMGSSHGTKLLGARRDFKRHGQSGMWVSEMFPHTATIVDDAAFVMSCATNLFNHAPAKLFMNTGSGQFGRPSMGSWVTYGLGSESQDLDRKSTRLNSSHVSISYAVFCLKKKK